MITYDLYGPWNHITGHHSPLYPWLNQQDTDAETFNIAKIVRLLTESTRVDRSKIIIGIPTHGRTFKLKNESINSVGSFSLGVGEGGQVYLFVLGFQHFSYSFSNIIF